MSKMISIRSPKLMHIRDGANRFFGPDQMWFHTHWQQRSGCGPTSCSIIFWYLSQTRPELQPLSAHNGSDKTEFVNLMDDVWQHVTPGRMGLNNVYMFIDGVHSYAKSRGVAVSTEMLDVPAPACKRPTLEETAAFISSAIARDQPVAFLNLSNGQLHNLDNWHWVTLIACDPERMTAVMYDQGVCRVIDLRLWLKTTTFGGAFVTIGPAAQSCTTDKMASGQ